MDQAGSLRRLARAGRQNAPAKAGANSLRGIAVASGKGGVGKTNTVANLAYVLKAMGKRSLVFDADIGLGNIHILLGLAPRYNLEHVISGEKTMDEVIMRGPGGIEILPASTGQRQFSALDGEEKLTLKTELEALEEDYDFILFDIGAGISSNVMYFCSAASDVVVVTTPEPTAFADAYALIKILSRDYARHEFKIIVNNVKSAMQADNVCDRLEKVADRFGLDARIESLGYIFYDESAPKAVLAQRLFAEMYPGSKAGQCIRKIAKNLIKMSEPANIEWDKALAI